jgi:hypothetical protein
MPGDYWNKLYENGSCPICDDTFKYYENGIEKHRSLSCLNGVAYCSPCGDMIRETRKQKMEVR